MVAWRAAAPIISLQMFFCRFSFSRAQLSVLRIETSFFGALYVIFAFTPESPFEQRCTYQAFRDPTFPSLIARWIAKAAIASFSQDRIIWEHKLAVAPRNVVQGDGPFAAYGAWLRQFYSSSSKSWGDLTLEW